jgi:orotidine-5'-phosphate decarboxylase
MDPVLEKIPLEGTTEEIITQFYSDILDACEKENCSPAIVKPNIAYFEQYGFDGLKALKNIVKKCRKMNIPVLCDAKRGDISATSRAYAKALFDYWDFQAITMNPWMGEDSVMPFLEYGKQGKGIYILVRTSNPSAKDFQEQIADGKKLYMHVAEKLVEWNKEGTCAVIGATAPKELQEIAEFFVKRKVEIPFLIPGIGKQGGSLKEVIEALRKSGTDLRIHRINASSSINYAWEKENKPKEYAMAAVKEVKRMNEESQTLI